MRFRRAGHFDLIDITLSRWTTTAFSLRYVACVCFSNDYTRKREEREKTNIRNSLSSKATRRSEVGERRTERESWIARAERARKDRMVRAAVSRGLFAADSFDRVFVDGENSKRFREKRVSFSRLSHDTLFAAREIKRARRIVHGASYAGTFSLRLVLPSPFSFFVPRPLPLPPISCTLGSPPARCVLVFLRRF